MPLHPRDPAQPEDLGLATPPGGPQYRAYVGPPYDYDLVAAMTFGLLTILGLRQQHRVLDVGCGSLRIGRLLLPYLNRGCYAGLEPNAWLVEDGIRREVGQDQIDIKQPRFVISDDATPLLDDGCRYDYVVAQSIFSHTGPDLLDRWIGQIGALLSPQGVLVATYLPDEVDNTTPGWIYPDCVAYRYDTLAGTAREHGLDCVQLDWRHPRQRWVLMAKPGFETDWLERGGLSWNTAFDRLNARGQHG